MLVSRGYFPALSSRGPRLRSCAFEQRHRQRAAYEILTRFLEPSYRRDLSVDQRGTGLRSCHGGAYFGDLVRRNEYKRRQAPPASRERRAYRPIGGIRSRVVYKTR